MSHAWVHVTSHIRHSLWLVYLAMELICCACGAKSTERPSVAGPTCGVPLQCPAQECRIHPLLLNGGEILEANRIRGDSNIAPDPARVPGNEPVRVPDQRNLRGIYGVCIARSGKVIDVVVYSSSGDHDFDRKVQRRLLQWEYKPFLLNGQPIALCGRVAITYGTPPGPIQPAAGAE